MDATAEWYLVQEGMQREAMRVDFLERVSEEDLRRWSDGRCSDEPVRLRQAKGRKPLDLLATTLAGIWLLSARVFGLFEREGIAGWRKCDAIVTQGAGVPLGGYALLSVFGKCGPLDNSRCTRSPGASGGWRGIYFDEGTWDGSDLFRPLGTRLTIASARTKNLVDAAGVTNIRFEKLADVERLAL